jgi:serine/threonine protein kinase
MGNSIDGEAAYNINLTEENMIGEGMFGQVYKIKRKKDGLLCAAKLFKIPKNAMLSKDEKGYERESKILKEAKHPFVIEYIEEFLY